VLGRSLGDQDVSGCVEGRRRARDARVRGGIAEGDGDGGVWVRAAVVEEIRV
jgi:hypothetical protein